MGLDAASQILENLASLVVSMSGDFHDFVKYFLAAGPKFWVMPSCIESSSTVFWSMIPSKWVNALFCVMVLCYETFRYDFPCRCFWEFPEFSVSEVITSEKEQILGALPSTTTCFYTFCYLRRWTARIRSQKPVETTRNPPIRKMDETVFCGVRPC
jgi:hypothetical protein